jgi:hypothetical protein
MMFFFEAVPGISKIQKQGLEPLPSEEVTFCRTADCPKGLLKN